MAGRYTSGREPFEVIEIDQDFCENIYGDSPCQAVLSDGLSKCYNTIGTCQDIPNYDGGVLTLRFCTDTPNLPRNGLAYFPYLASSPKVKPAELNPGGAKRTSTALGKRATITATFNDAPWNDKIVDLYQSERITGDAQADGVGYNPVDRSSFWRKWKARNLYYLNRPMRYISGYIENGQIVDSVTRYFVITGFSGPDKNGNVSIEGQDILYLAQREKAQAPRASKGKLVSDISDIDSSFTLNPVGIGDEEYPASGYGRFGSEIIEFTRSSDTFTVTSDGRGSLRTTASAHTAGDTFQLCVVFDSRRPDQILYTLLSEYSEIADEFLDTVQWEAEALDYLPTLYDGVIASPTGVAELINEMCEQMYFYAWFDERTNKVKILSVRPADGETVTVLTEDDNLIKGTLACKDDPEQVITRVVINYALADPTGSIDEQTNYRVTDVYGDLVEEGQDRNRGSRTKVINSRWIEGGNAAAAEALGDRLLARYKVPPRTITWQMDAKDRDLWVADFCTITTDAIVNPDGISYAVPVQVLGASESQAGTSFSYMGQQFQFELPANPNVKTLIQAEDRQNLNIRDWYSERYGDTPQAGDVINVIIRPGVIIGAVSLFGGQFTSENDFFTPTLTDDALPVFIGELDGSEVTTKITKLRDDSVVIDSVSYTMNHSYEFHPIPVSIDTGVWPAGVELNIYISAGAQVLGAGGNGVTCVATNGSGQSRFIACSGGHAIKVRHPVSVENYGLIASGGSGGAGSWTQSLLSPGNVERTPGGGGAGYQNGPTLPAKNEGGTGGGVTSRSVVSQSTSGTYPDGGVGAHTRTVTTSSLDKIAGNGGDLGQASTDFDLDGSAEVATLNKTTGHAIIGSSDINWVNRGDIIGTEV